MVYVPEWLMREMHQHCLDESPNEASGVVLRGKEPGPGRRYEHVRMPNASANPRTEFSWAVDDHRRLYECMDAEGMDIWLIYHSHPETMPEPSSVDERASWHVGVHHLIFGLAGGPEDRWVNSYMCIEPGTLALETLVTS